MSSSELLMVKGYLREFPMTDKTTSEIISYMKGLRELHPGDYKDEK